MILFKDGMNALGEAFSDPVAHEEKYGIPPRINDFGIASQFLYSSFGINIRRKSHHLLQLNPKPKGPSMLFFYQNLKEVIHNGFWMSPGPKQRVVPKECVRQPRACNVIDHALLFDYSCADNDGTKAVMFSGKLQELCEELDVCPIESINKMTPAEWLFNYSKPVDSSAEPEKDERFLGICHRKVEVSMFEKLRTQFSSEEMADMCAGAKRLDRAYQEMITVLSRRSE